jgi:hypothetical protein
MTTVIAHAALTLCLVAIVIAVVRSVSKKPEVATSNNPLDPTDPSSEASESVTPSSDGVKPVAPRPGTPREKRREEILARQQTRACLYCEKRARFAMPQLHLIRPLLDPLYRYLNVVPVNRWQIEVTLDITVPLDLCEAHHAIARGHLERRLTELQLEYATFTERQRHEIYEFEAYALDERMLDDATAIKRNKKS